MFALVLTPGCGQDVTPPAKGDRAAFEKARQASQEHAADPRFDEFSQQCDRYHTTQTRVRSLEVLMSRREASEAEIAEWQALSSTLETQRSDLLAFIAQDRFSNEDRDTMRWIMNPGN